MNEYYVTNRDVIKNLALNTGTSADPTFTKSCTFTDLALNMDLETQDFSVFCDAIRRSIKTGVALTLQGTVNIDINNVAIQKVIGDIQTLITAGTISQFNNQLVQFELLTGVTNSVLEYTKYQVSVSYSLEAMGGNAEDVSEFAITMTINGTGTEISA
jgi:hypothetical protein